MNPAPLGSSANHPTLFPAEAPPSQHNWLRSASDNTPNHTNNAVKGPANILIDNGKLRVSIAIRNIVFAKAEHVYVSIYFCNNQRILQRGSLSRLLTQLPKDQFLQVHRSYIVNLAWVDSWTKAHVVIAGKRIPISRSRRNAVLAILMGGAHTKFT